MSEEKSTLFLLCRQMGEGPDGLPKGVDHRTLAPFPKAAGVAEGLHGMLAF